MENAFGQPQSVVVFGGSSDIARALTRKLCAARAHTVVLCGRNPDLLEAAVNEAREYGATTTDTVIFDALDPTNAERVVNEAFDKVGGHVDLVVISLGLLGDETSAAEDATAALAMAMVNYTWPVSALSTIRRRLVAQGSGRILVMSSVAAVRVRPSMYHYAGAKAGLDRFCGAMADSLEGTGVTLQLVRPGVVRTKMTAGQPDNVPFTTGPDQVATTVMRSLGEGDRVIWSPPVLRYVFAILRNLPRVLWLKVIDR